MTNNTNGQIWDDSDNLTRRRILEQTVRFSLDKDDLKAVKLPFNKLSNNMKKRVNTGLRLLGLE